MESSPSPISIASGRTAAALVGAASIGFASIALGFGAGSIPSSNVVARWRAGVDLRTVGSGTVSGSGLYEVAGTGPLIVVGLFELAKGTVGPLLAGRQRPVVAALAGAAAVAGHNWSPFLRGAGGRGISPAMGALLVNAPAGSGVLLAGLALGKLAGETALGSFIADLLLVPVSARVHGRTGRASALAVLVPMVAKRLLGNGPPLHRGPSVYLYRLVFDRDTWEKPSGEVHTSNEPGGPKAGSLEAGSLEAGSLEAGSQEAGSQEAGSQEARSPKEESS